MHSVNFGVSCWLTKVLRVLSYFEENLRGSVAPMFALSLIPVLGLAGMAVDYSRAGNVRAGLQVSLDAAMLAAAKDGSSLWAETAQQVFQANIDRKGSLVATPAFATQDRETFSGSVSATVPATLVSGLGFSSIDVRVAASAKRGALPDDSCILTLDHDKPLFNESMTFHGSPNINLSNCTLRSNTSLSCNGSPTGARALAAGTASGCSISSSNSNVVPDIHAALAANITALCGSKKGGATWAAGIPPNGPMVQLSSTSTHVEYHICGDLTLEGVGYLTGQNPASDTVIIIENGSLIVSTDASIGTSRVAIVLTGNNKTPSSVEFPNGAGNLGALSLSPPRTIGNPWRGVALYQDPALNKNVDNVWGPGSTFTADGLIYLPQSNVTTSGITQSGKSACTKIVTNTFTTNGSPYLNFKQAAIGCTEVGLTQWSGMAVVLTR